MEQSDQQLEHLFYFLVSQLRDTAWLGLGRAPHPVTGKTERNLDLARLQIDLLGMLDTKTEGRRSESETEFLRRALTQLRMVYVEELEKPEEESGKDESDRPQDAPETQSPSETQSGPESDDASGGDEEPKGRAGD
ncbi:MAG: DUF1844 domain-containing protein [Candidatus Eisenbacteria bacterium]|nr:DUF1844 domain-containing protein [Candidatus Eisenbacteria bacterium]